LRQSAIVDTGPLVAFLDKHEKNHAWTKEQIRNLEVPLLVCEPVLTEAFFLLRRLPPAREALLSLVEKGALQIAFNLNEELKKVRLLCEKYRDRPMSLADACIVRMVEREDTHAVFTLDSDFSIYRKHGRHPLSLISPSKKELFSKVVYGVK